MGKKNKNGFDLTEDQQLQLMLQSTELASVYWDDPDKGVTLGAHPLEKEVQKHRKKKKKHLKNSKKENGLDYFTVNGKENKRNSLDKAIDRVDKSIRKEERKKRESDVMGTLMTYDGSMTTEEDDDDEVTYHADPLVEKFADQIAEAVYSSVKEEKPVPKPQINMMANGSEVSLLSFHLGRRRLFVYDFDGNVINQFEVDIDPTSVVSLINELMNTIREELLEDEDEEEEAPVEKGQLPKQLLELAASKSSQPVQTEDSEEVAAVEAAETTKTVVVETKEESSESTRLTQRIHIPDDIRNRIPDSYGVEETVSASGITKLSGNGGSFVVTPQLPK